jgi:hypothetical protein
MGDKARCLEALRPLARLSLPLLARLTLDAGAATGQGVRWLEGAHLPALRHLGVTDYSASRPDHPCVAALTVPRWSALEALDLHGYISDSGDAAALSATLAPTLRRLAVWSWPFCTEGCADQWPQLRSLEVGKCSALAAQLGRVRLPRLERLAITDGQIHEPDLVFAALRPSLPALRALELTWCFCDESRCPMAGCTHPKTVALLEELRTAWPGLEVRLFEEKEDWAQR